MSKWQKEGEQETEARDLWQMLGRGKNEVERGSALTMRRDLEQTGTRRDRDAGKDLQMLPKPFLPRHVSSAPSGHCLGT